MLQLPTNCDSVDFIRADSEYIEEYRAIHKNNKYS